ncbi:MAG: hypothetical protein WEC00_02030 [Dongiaceae bacterium]
MKSTSKLELDWSCLLGFDQVSDTDRERVPNWPKIGVKQMVRRGDEVDSVALARLTKIGFKDNIGA